MVLFQPPISPSISSAFVGFQSHDALVKGALVKGALVKGAFCLSLSVLFFAPRAECQNTDGSVVSSSKTATSPSSAAASAASKELNVQDKPNANAPMLASEVEEIKPDPAMKPAVKAGEFRCPADNPAWWEEAKEGGWEGYGETWDLHTCEEGNQFFFPGTVGRWRPYLRPVVMNVRPSGKPIDVQFYSVLLPTVAFGSIALVGVLAWLLAMFTRKKKLALVDVPCPSCGLTVPVAVDEKKEKTLFCPRCGGASFVVKGHGKKAEVEVHILQTTLEETSEESTAGDDESAKEASPNKV